jgi:foldase protein PrsA
MPAKKTAKAGKTEVSVLAPETGRETLKSKRNKKIGVAVVIVLLAALLLWKFRTLFIVAVVNGRPVTRFELESKIMARYGKQTLEEIISERLVTEKARMDKVVVSAADIDSKIADLTKLLAGRGTLEEAMAQQGITIEELRRQIYLQSLVEKIAEPLIKIEDKELSDYITQNKAYMMATEEAALKQEAMAVIKRQKASEVFQKIFADLKSSAKIINFLNAN